MPYIKKELREKLDDDIDVLISKIMTIPPNEQDGVVNYTVFRMLLGLYEPNRAMGVLESVKQEFYRRKIGPYEDQAILRNGDIA